MLLSDLEQVVWLQVGVVYNIFASKLAEASVFFGGPAGHVVSIKKCDSVLTVSSLMGQVALHSKTQLLK